MSLATDKLAQARLKAETLTPETVTIAGVDYVALVPHQTLAESIAVGAFLDGKTLTLSIRKNLFTASPVNGSTATARGLPWRVLKSDPNLVTYEITLQSVNK